MTQALHQPEANMAAPRPRIIVTYNGLDSEIPYVPAESMQALLNQALDAFGVHNQRHVMALWTTSGVELPLEGSVQDAGVKPGEILVLRPSAVRGGC